MPAQRNQESLAVLKEFDIDSENIMFIGEHFKFKDGLLHENISSLCDWLQGFFQSNQDIGACYVPALEGGHPDHDILHTAVVTVLDKSGKSGVGIQYPLYNAKNVHAPFFKVLTPIAENGLVDEIKLTFKQKCKYFTYCFRYKSQWKTWIGLTPFIFVHFFFNGKQYLQLTSLKRLGQRPHSGQLYYEARKFLSWNDFLKSVSTILGK